MDGPPGNDECSICLRAFNLPYQANCSHWFCGHCILQLWHHGSALQPCLCPLCRRQITLLIPSEATLQQHDNAEATQTLERIELYNHRFGGGYHSLTQRLQDLPFFLRRLSIEMLDPRRSLPLVVKARMLLALAVSISYLLSPVDIIPEGVFGLLGLVDDLLILLFGFLHLAAIYRNLLLRRHGAA